MADLRRIPAIAALAVAYGAAAAGCSGTASTAGPTLMPPTSGVAAIAPDRRRGHPFTCTGTMGRYYTKQTVNGIVVKKNVPKGVTVLDWQSRVLITSPKPALDNGYDGGYWKQTYHMNEWNLGTTADYSFHFMLPDTRLGGTFQAMLLTEFAVGGNWQNWMDCTES